MTGPGAKSVPDITCPVCHSVNAGTRTFCWKCAADLHAPAPDPAAPPPEPKVIVPIQPILIGIGVALAAIALITVVVVLLGGTPAATTSPSLELPSVAATAAAPGASGGSGGAGGSPVLATFANATAAPPPTQGAPATPKVTAIPGPVILSFTGPKSVDCTDPSYSGFITLHWLTDNNDSTELSIDGPGVYNSYPGSKGDYLVPFSCGAGEHTYTLTTVGGNGPAATKNLTIREG